MSVCNLIICQLTNKDGEILDPFAPNALSFTTLCSSRKKLDKDHHTHIINVLISGYIVVYVEGRNMSSPIPFEIIKQICIFDPDNAFLDFQTRKFECAITPVIIGTKIAKVEIAIDIQAATRSCCWTDILVQPADMPDRVSISEKRVYDCVCFDCGTTVAYEMFIKALTQQYNALSDGIRKTYTNVDELAEYGHTGIIPPSDNTLNSLFVNGVLQPKVNYAIIAGNLNLLTDDVPPRDAPLIISYVFLGLSHGSNVTASSNSYVTLSTGSKRVFFDNDEIIEYGDQGIPSPNEISFCNLFINGALQPTTNYVIKKGILELTTADIPPNGAMIILEYFTIKDDGGSLLCAEVYEYNARSSGNKIFTNTDEITMYGDQGIPDPNLYSFDHLFVNGVMQPEVNYSVEKGLMVLKTTDSPGVETPITLQLVCVFAS